MEIGAELLLKGTKVAGVYDKDPVKFSDATLYEHLSFLDVLNQGLKVMDAAAISLCMDNRLPLRVFNVGEGGTLKRIVEGEPIGTLVR
jgi:uridylate kinase